MVALLNETNQHPNVTRFSDWWKHLEETPSGYPADLIERLGTILRTATKKDAVVSNYAAGKYKHKVAYAVFDFSATKSQTDGRGLPKVVKLRRDHRSN